MIQLGKFSPVSVFGCEKFETVGEVVCSVEKKKKHGSGKGFNNPSKHCKYIVGNVCSCEQTLSAQSFSTLRHFQTFSNPWDGFFKLFNEKQNL